MVLLTSISPPSEGVRHEERETAAFLDGEGLGSGTLYVAETCVSWSDGSGRGFSLEYPSISLHALSRDLNTHAHEHLYLMVHSKFKDYNKKHHAAEEEEEDDDDDDDDDSHSSNPFTEIRFVPNDKTSLEIMFSTLCECQALHSDFEDSDSDFEGDEYDVEEAEQGQSLCSSEEGTCSLTTVGCRSMLESTEQEQHKSVAEKIHVAGDRTNSSPTGLEDEVESKSNNPLDTGQFHLDVDH